MLLGGKRLITLGCLLILAVAYSGDRLLAKDLPGAGGNQQATVNAILGFSQASYTGAVGTNTSIDLVVNSGSNGLSIVSVAISYPANLLRFIGADYGGSAFPTTVREAEDTAGTITLSRANLNNGGFSGSQGLIAHLNFTLIAQGSTLIQINQNASDVRDYIFAENVLASVTSAAVTVTQAGGGTSKGPGGGTGGGGGGGGNGGGGSGSGGSGGTGSGNTGGSSGSTTTEEGSSISTDGSQSNPGNQSNQTQSNKRATKPVVTTYPDTDNFRNLVVKALTNQAIISWESPTAYTYELKYQLTNGQAIDAQTIRSDQPNTLFQAVISNLESCRNYGFTITLFEEKKTVEMRNDSFTTLGCKFLLPVDPVTGRLSSVTSLLIAIGITALIGLISFFTIWAVKIFHGR